MRLMSKTKLFLTKVIFPEEFIFINSTEFDQNIRWVTGFESFAVQAFTGIGKRSVSVSVSDLYL